MAQNRNKVEEEKSREDLGFGTKATSLNARLVTSDGNFNVKKMGQSFSARMNVYHNLIMMPWVKFAFVVLLFYLFTNLIFGTIYYFLGDNSLNGLTGNHAMSKFWHAFFFSAQTLTTVGYGTISPATFMSSLISSFEALLGLMVFAIMTGLLYGRFSRPIPRIVYSDNALIAPYLDINGFMIRLANERNNQLINVTASIIFSRNETVNGKLSRKYYNLDLERSKVTYFAMSWTLVHPITESSPIFNETPQSFKDSDAEFLVSIEATNDTMSDPIHSRKSYLYPELVYGAGFVPMMHDEGGSYYLDLSKIGSYEHKTLNG